MNLSSHSSTAAFDALTMGNTMQDHCIGIFVADGSDAETVGRIRRAALEAGARVEIIAPLPDEATLSDGSRLVVDAALGECDCTGLDAIAIVLSEVAARCLAENAAARDFVLDAYCDLKTLGVNASARGLLMAAGVAPGAGVIDITDTRGFISSAKAQSWTLEVPAAQFPLHAQPLAAAALPGGVPGSVR